MVLPNWIDLHKTYESLLVTSYLEDQSSDVSHQDLLCSWSTMKTAKTFDTNNNHDHQQGWLHNLVPSRPGSWERGYGLFRKSELTRSSIFIFIFMAWCLMHLKLLSPNHKYTEIPIFKYNGGAPSFPSCNQLFQLGFHFIHLSLTVNE